MGCRWCHRQHVVVLMPARPFAHEALPRFHYLTRCTCDVQMDMDSSVKKALIAFRDSTVHSIARGDVEDAIKRGVGRDVVGILAYRVCATGDVVLKETTPSYEFISCCASRAAAESLLRRPPNPKADRIVEVEVTGRVIYMVYDDGLQGSRKMYENDVIVPLAAITRVKEI